MNVELERILGTLEVIIEVGIELSLPNNDTTYLAPFVWDVTQKGEFNFINLGLDEHWITSTDIQIAIKGWQSVEREGHLDEYKDPDYYDDNVIFITPEIVYERAKIYEILAENIKKNLYISRF